MKKDELRHIEESWQRLPTRTGSRQRWKRTVSGKSVNKLSVAKVCLISNNLAKECSATAVLEAILPARIAAGT